MFLSVLGPLRVTVQGAPADLGGPRQRAVLARLAVAGGAVVSTDRIVDDLWGGADVPARALATLQVHVSHLRRALEPGRLRRTPASVLISAPPGYALRLPASEVDAWHFDDLVRRAAGTEDGSVHRAAGTEDGSVRRAAGTGPAEQLRLLDEALGCWQGDAYAEVADEPWAVPEIARLAELRLLAVESRAEAQLALGRPAAVVAELERHLHDNPGREGAVRLLALALYRCGRQGDALAALRRTRDHLADELGVDPGPVLRAMEADILAQAPDLDAPAARPEPILLRRESPATLGRETELAAITAAAGEVTRHGARIVLIGGDAGAGKTTLAEAAVAALTGDGWHGRRGRCPEVAGAPPGWAWSEALGSQVRTTGSPNPFELGRTIAASLGTGRTVVLLDDVHRADDLTLQLLRQVVALLAEYPVLILVTYRTGESGDDSGDELEATVGALLGSTAAHLVLRGLDSPAVAALARQHGLDEAGPELLAMVAERTGGNPLFVRELARLIAAEGTGAADSAVPAGVREVLRRRVARLPDPVAMTLRQVAVLGREADLDVLAGIAGRDPDDLLDYLEAAVLAGLLDEPAPGRVRFTHALVRDTLYDDTPLLRRARLHSRALAVLADHADAPTLARHACAAAGPATAQEAIRYPVAAAHAAEQAGSWREAAAQWREALRLHALAGTRATGSAAELLASAVTAHARAGDVIRARAIYLDALAGHDDIAVLTAWDAPLIWTTRDGREPSHPAITAIRRHLAGDLADDTRVRLLLALFRELEGYDEAEGQQVSAEALALARGVDDARLLCAALNVRAYAALGPDLREERRNVAEEYLTVAAAAGQIDHEAVAHWLLFLDSAARTDLAGARAEMGLAVARSTTGQLSGLLAVVGIFTALLELLAGRVGEALDRYAEVSRRLAEHGALNGAAMATVGRIGAAMSNFQPDIGPEAAGPLSGAGSPGPRHVENGSMVRGDLAHLREELVAVEAAYPGRVTDPLVLALLDAGLPDQARQVWAGRLPIDRNYYWLGFTTLRGHAAARLGDRETGEQVFAELLPFAGRIAGLDSGTLYAGPVDAALHALSGDPAYARSAAELTARLRTPEPPGGGTAAASV
ncbi:BTAD domain-containing putative transcriptional regulator [Actinoplanes sp. GCM10030250]|uniref:BTAD domain-containing putative transcriptional regulator n=1 Tax=Actinoplanes sp. GCM10030250 TaxID=3273376 RepID=UPI003621AB3A